MVLLIVNLCKSIYGPKVEANQTDSAYLKKAIAVMKMMKCTESEAYFQASYYMYKINPTADAATGCGYMAYKKGDFDTAIKYFDEALSLESDSEKRRLSYVILLLHLCSIVRSCHRPEVICRKLSVSRKTLEMLISCLHSFMLPARTGMTSLL